MSPANVMSGTLIDFHRRFAAGGVAIPAQLGQAGAVGTIRKRYLGPRNKCINSIYSGTRCVLDHPDPLSVIALR